MKDKHIFYGLLGLMVLIKLSDILFGFPKEFAGRTAVFPWLELIIALAFGLVGIHYYAKTILPKFLKDKLTVGFSFFLGVGFGGAFALYDYIFILGDMSVGWPTSIPFYLWGAILTEILFRLFAISLLFWLGTLVFKYYPKQVFWAAASVLSFAAVVMMLVVLTNLQMTGTYALGALGLLIFLSEMASFYLLQKAGFLSSLLFRIGFYSVWHILWPIIFY